MRSSRANPLAGVAAALAVTWLAISAFCKFGGECELATGHAKARPFPDSGSKLAWIRKSSRLRRNAVHSGIGREHLASHLQCLGCKKKRKGGAAVTSVPKGLWV